MITASKTRSIGIILLAVICFAGFVSAAGEYAPEAGSAELSKKGRKAKAQKVQMDPSLPNVLIIGDSISIGYTPYVTKILSGKANVIHNQSNAQGTTFGREKLAEWLGNTKWAVIHFNWGLHDLKHVKAAGTSQNSNDPKDPYQADLPHYEENMKVLVRQLKATGAKLIFATTTPYPAGVNPSRKPEDAVKYNKVALNIMKENGIKINDLYSLALPRMGELQKPVNVHFTDKGSEELAKQVVESILKELGQPSTK